MSVGRSLVKRTVYTLQWSSAAAWQTVEDIDSTDLVADAPNKLGPLGK